MSNLDTWTNAELFSQYAAILAELRSRKVLRTANAPAGDYAEWLCQHALGGKLAPTLSEVV